MLLHRSSGLFFRLLHTVQQFMVGLVNQPFITQDPVEDDNPFWHISGSHYFHQATSGPGYGQNVCLPQFATAADVGN